MQNFWVRRWELYCTQHHNLHEYSCCLGSFSSVLPMNIKKRCPVHTAHAIVLLHNWFKLQCQRIWILSKALLPCLWPKGTHCIYLPILVAVPALSCSVVSDSLPPHRLSSTRLLCPWGFSRQKYWSGLPCPPPRDLPNPGLNPGLPHCRKMLYHLSHQGS